MAQGSVVIQVFTSDAEIPLQNAAVSILNRNSNGSDELVAFRLTDHNGLTQSVAVNTPGAEESINFVTGSQPFSLVDIMAEQVGYDRIVVQNVQVFPDVTTKQKFRLIPTAELPDAYDETQLFAITPQDL